MLFNHKKSVILICRSNYMKNVDPVFTLNGKIIDESDTVRYLGHRNSENYDEFMGYLGMVHSIIQESDVSSVFVIGDWNAEINANSVFGSELSSFCTDHSYVISDIEHLGIDSGSFTFFSEAHGSTSWIDHCVCRVYGSGSCQYIFN